MGRMKHGFVVIALLLLAVVLLSSQPAYAEKKLYLGGSMALTGAYAEDVAAILAAFEDYTRYVNETKMAAPWATEKLPADISFELLWRDDELKPAKALSVYEELKAKGMMVFRVSGSPQALALKDRLFQDKMGATSMTSGPFLMKPPQTIFTHYPIYTDHLAAIADWFKENWKESRKPRVAYLTSDNAMGKSIEIPEMEAYLKKIGYDFVGSQYVPLVPVAAPTTQLMWLKEKKVDLALGTMINPGSQPTIKEAIRLDMGPHLGTKITFGFASPSHLQVMLPAMGELANGVVVAGSYPAWDDMNSPGIKFAHDLQEKYRPGKRITPMGYVIGLIEGITQVEALRLALKDVPFEKLTRADVLDHGFYKIKNLSTGGLTATPLTYGPGKIEGVDQVLVQQAQKGKIVKLGTWPLRGIYDR
jgi:branched-chain amino acid transport system substrate-binding protein